MNRTEFVARLRALDACAESLEWIAQTPGEPADLWAACPRGDWLIWLLAAMDYDARVMRHIACDCAEDVLPIYERHYPNDRRPREAIAVARRYADGEATEEERVAAWDAARVAAWDTAMDAGGAAAWDAARAAAWAAAWDAASAAAWGAARAAAGDAAWARQAGMVRARVTWADVEGQLDRAGR